MAEEPKDMQSKCWLEMSEDEQNKIIKDIQGHYQTDLIKTWKQENDEDNRHHQHALGLPRVRNLTVSHDIINNLKKDGPPTQQC